MYLTSFLQKIIEEHQLNTVIDLTCALGADSLTVFLIVGCASFIASKICNLPILALSNASSNIPDGTPSLVK